MTEHERLHEIVLTQARSRAFRTFLQSLAFDVGAAVVLVLYTAFASATSWGEVQWGLLAFTLVKTATVTVLSYLMKRVFRNFPDAG